MCDTLLVATGVLAFPGRDVGGWSAFDHTDTECHFQCGDQEGMGHRREKWGELTQNLLGTGNGVRKGCLPGSLTTEWPGNGYG